MRAEKVQTLLLFGATGDLARRMLLPSLYGLDADGLLPHDLKIIATARTDHDDAAYRDIARKALAEHVPHDFYAPLMAERFVTRLSYVPLDAKDAKGFRALAERIDPDQGLAIFLSTAPTLFKAMIDGLSAAGLTGPKVRMALEKPLGSDLQSSREINDAVAAAFPEQRIFRIDHYLGKETVQNLLALRFANVMFEPLWNSTHIDHVEISVAETIGLEGRGDYYDGAGALRDMVQNHMLQLLALVAMEPPSQLRRDRGPRREGQGAALAATDCRASDIVTGQYDGYARGIGPRFGHRDVRRLEGACRQLALGRRAVLVAHRQEECPSGAPKSSSSSSRCLIRSSPKRGATTQPNTLVIAIQPDENIRLQLMAKTPGLDRDGIRLREVPLDLGLANAFADHRRRIAYERLLLDLIEGDPTLFVRRDEVEAQWQWIDGVRRALAEAGVKPKKYRGGKLGAIDGQATDQEQRSELE